MHYSQNNNSRKNGHFSFSGSWRLTHYLTLTAIWEENLTGDLKGYPKPLISPSFISSPIFHRLCGKVAFWGWGIPPLLTYILVWCEIILVCFERLIQSCKTQLWVLSVATISVRWLGKGVAVPSHKTESLTARRKQVDDGGGCGCLILIWSGTPMTFLNDSGILLCAQQTS